ncbi:hypothetical protein D7Y27_20165 [Corallococcus sp. AB004]|uniref:hypothetical protein n=1 Tax=Corallococcus TaxID=83461 RepID=UPI000EA20E38|nr:MULTISPECIES: hypothetical protein [Corallococcus]RKI40563.1 hypothetical protein D7Y27_20165 [Corallococcus sp. AB004]NPC45940.1 hypothetical protein [Corallococcus exiguus]NRD44934.1 hypothetical protein [Corallococcus exiguus]RKH83471.1 hypothetical protein D7X99_12700 [Corallococcus sp. AB032C]RKH97079.1 hypothetical protein D7Y04_28130 [Corallococcus sp. AB038B]
MEKAGKTDSFMQSTRMPTSTVDALTAWWDRRLPNNLAYSGYLPFKVKIESNALEDGVRVLRFFVVGHPSPADKPFELKLQLEHGYVWPDLPSTAQWGFKDQFGFLFLTSLWLSQNGVPEALAEGGGKWPIGAALAPALALQVLEALQDEGLRQQVQRLMAEHLPSKG